MWMHVRSDNAVCACTHCHATVGMHTLPGVAHSGKVPVLDTDETQAVTESQLDKEVERLARLNAVFPEMIGVPDPPAAS